MDFLFLTSHGLLHPVYFSSLHCVEIFLLTLPVTNILLSLLDIFQSLSYHLLCCIMDTVECTPPTTLFPLDNHLVQDSSLFLLCLLRLLFLSLPPFSNIGIPQSSINSPH